MVFSPQAIGMRAMIAADALAVQLRTRTKRLEVGEIALNLR
jgi:hypothetical protein